jgi:hypothetical protein
LAFLSMYASLFKNWSQDWVSRNTSFLTKISKNCDLYIVPWSLHTVSHISTDVEVKIWIWVQIDPLGKALLFTLLPSLQVNVIRFYESTLNYFDRLFAPGEGWHHTGGKLTNKYPHLNVLNLEGCMYAGIVSWMY